MHECGSDSSRAAAEDEQLNIYKGRQLACIMVPKRPPTVSVLQCDDASKMLVSKHMFCFIPNVSEGHQACQVKGSYYLECAESEIQMWSVETRVFCGFMTNYIGVCVCGEGGAGGDTFRKFSRKFTVVLPTYIFLVNSCFT